MLCADMHYKRLEAFILIIKYQMRKLSSHLHFNIFQKRKKLIRYSFFIMIATTFVSRAVTDKLRRTIGK